MGGNDKVRLEDLESAVEFLKRVFTGPVDEDRLVRTIKALETEIKKRRKK
jgi:predicted ATP-grasp superfamily ATP-dependent carboligase